MTPVPADSSSAGPRRLRSIAVIGLIAAMMLVGLVAGIVIRAIGPGDDSLRREAREDASQGRWDSARAKLSRLLQPSAEDHFLCATASLALGDAQEASDALAQVPNEGVNRARRAFLEGQIENARHRARPMEAALREAIAADPNLAPARRLLIYLYGLQERRPELMEQFAALAERGPLTVDLVLHWCLSRGEIGDPAENRAALEAFVAADPEDRASRLALAEVFRRLGRLDEATRTLEPLSNQDRDALAIRAQIEFDRGDTTAATAILERSPGSHPAIARLNGRRALARRDGPAAVVALKAADMAEPDHQETLFVLAQALRLTGETAEADRVAARAAAHQALRAALVQFSNAKEAKPGAFRSLGHLCEAVGLKPEASAWYRLAIAADPLDAAAQKALFRLKAEVRGR